MKHITFKNFNTRYLQKNRQGGAAMLLVVVFFLFITLAIIAGLVSTTIREFRNAIVNLNSKQSYFLSESGSEDALYRISNNITISNNETLTLNNNSATTTITSPFETHKQITTLGDVSSHQRTTSITLANGAGISFRYGLQADTGGMVIRGSPAITGDAYANGSINALNSIISGSVTAADSPSLTLNQSNMLPSAPTDAISFGNVALSQDLAQSFQVSTTVPINKIALYIKKVGDPSDATIRLVADDNGSPSTTNLPVPFASLTATSVTGDYSWVETIFASNPSLIAHTTYWLVIDTGSPSSSDYYVIGANDDGSYSLGTAKTGVYDGSWAADNLDSYFKIYTGGLSAYIGGGEFVGGLTAGGGGVGDEWASSIFGTSVSGNLYCASGSNNNQACDTSHGSAPAVELPFSEATITAWKDNAAIGDTISGSTDCPGGDSGGNCVVDSHNAAFGPGKITGNLTVDDGGTLTLTGTVWVVGTITVSSDATIKLSESYDARSEILISDSYVNLSGGSYTGSGISGSYLFVISTSRCPYDTYCSGNNAITVSGGTGAVALAAQYGLIDLGGGASISAAAGNYLNVHNGLHVNYESLLAAPTFMSGPSNTWSLQTWKESQ